MICSERTDVSVWSRRFTFTNRQFEKYLSGSANDDTDIGRSTNDASTDAQIGAVKVGGNRTSGDLAAGTGIEDVATMAAMVNRAAIGGMAKVFARVEFEIGIEELHMFSPNVVAKPLTLHSGAHNDLLALGIANNLFVREN